TDEEHGRLEGDLAREEAQVLDLERERDRLAALHAELRIEATRATTAFEASLGEIERVGMSAQEAEREIGARAEEAAETERRIQEAQAEAARKEDELTREIELKSEKEQVLQASRERFGHAKGSVDDLETQARDLRREHHEITDRLHRAELERAESESEMRV